MNQLYIYICSHISSLVRFYFSLHDLCKEVGNEDLIQESILKQRFGDPKSDTSYLSICLFFKPVFLFFLNKFIYLFLAALGLRCCTQAFSSCSEQGLLFVAVCRLLTAVASLVPEHGL